MMRRLLLILILGVCVATATTAGQGGSVNRFNADALNALTLRNLGPTIDTGRVQDLAIDPEESQRVG